MSEKATTIQDLLKESISVKQDLLQSSESLQALSDIADALIQAVDNGHTIYLCGNGGSACDAMHFCEELVARFRSDRPGIRAMHFLDSATMSCWSNDYDYESVFERQAETFCDAGDVLIGISTSGNSANVLRAMEKARAQGAVTVGFTKSDGGKLQDIADFSFGVPSEKTERIQEVHITAIHILCEILEDHILKK